MDNLPEKRGLPPAPPDLLLRMPGYLVGELHKLIRRISAEFFPADPAERLRRAHLAVLMCIAEQGPLCQREVSDSLRLDPGDLVGAIDALEERGYVIRGRDPRDRRRYALEITDAGRQGLQRQYDRSLRLYEALYAPLTGDEIDELRTLILRILAHHDPRFVDEARRMRGDGTGSGGESDQSPPD